MKRAAIVLALVVLMVGMVGCNMPASTQPGGLGSAQSLLDDAQFAIQIARVEVGRKYANDAEGLAKANRIINAVQAVVTQAQNDVNEGRTVDAVAVKKLVLTTVSAYYGSTSTTQQN